MQNIILEIQDKNVFRLIKDLEKLNLVKIISPKSIGDKQLSELFENKLPGKVAEDMQTYISKERESWTGRIT